MNFARDAPRLAAVVGLASSATVRATAWSRAAWRGVYHSSGL